MQGSQRQLLLKWNRCRVSEAGGRDARTTLGRAGLTDTGCLLAAVLEGVRAWRGLRQSREQRLWLSASCDLSATFSVFSSKFIEV